MFQSMTIATPVQCLIPEGNLSEVVHHHQQRHYFMPYPVCKEETIMGNEKQSGVFWKTLINNAVTILFYHLRCGHYFGKTALSFIVMWEISTSVPGLIPDLALVAVWAGMGLNFSIVLGRYRRRSGSLWLPNFSVSGFACLMVSLS